MNPKLMARYIAGSLLSLVGMGAGLFWPAGTLAWCPGWAALAVMLGWMTGMTMVLIYIHPGLMAERMDRTKRGLRWDTVIVSTISLTTLLRYITAGLDERFGWSSGIPLAAQLIALLVCLLGYALFTWATASNPFFSNVVRIQTDRGHTVASGGPYKTIRHPAYLGVILYELSVSILLASWWALIPSLISVLLLVLRTALEDRTLKAELAGYADYASRVRWRLLPGIW